MPECKYIFTLHVCIFLEHLYGILTFALRNVLAVVGMTADDHLKGLLGSLLEIQKGGGLRIADM